MALNNFLIKLYNKPIGFLSFCYIVFIFFISVFAYLISPDKSVNSNLMQLSIHSKPPLFNVKTLNIPDERDDQSFISKIFFGRKKIGDQILINKIKWENDILFFQPYGIQKEIYEKVPKEKFKKNTTYLEIEKKYIKNKTFLLGTDKYGRDLLSRIIIGSRVSFSIGFVAVLISLLFGVFFGLISGYYGGILDKIIMWIINVIWSIPTLLMVIAISLALGKGFWQVFIAVGMTMWVEVARIVRGQVISIREKPYIKASISLGFTNLRIILFHIFPMIIPSLIVISSANFASAILIESGLSFLGIGTQPPIPSWGSMIKEHFRYILLGKAYLAIFPGFAIMSLVLAFMTFGNSIRDLLDERN